MPAPTKPRAKKTNKPAEFKETLAPAMSTTLVIPEITAANRSLMTIGSVLLFALLVGMLGGLVLRSALVSPLVVSPGDVAVVTNPQYARILQAKEVAATGTQTIQVSQTASTAQPAQGATDLQAGGGINQLQPVLSAYDSQGSVGGPAR